MKRIIFILFIFVMLPLCAQGKEKKILVRDSIVAKRFILVDDDGKKRAIIKMQKGYPGVFLFTKNGEPKLGFGLPHDKPYISLGSKNGPRIIIVVDEIMPRIAIYNNIGFKVASLTIGRDGLAKIELLKKPKFNDKRYSKQKGEMKKITKKEFLDFFKKLSEMSKGGEKVTPEEAKSFFDRLQAGAIEKTP